MLACVIWWSGPQHGDGAWFTSNLWNPWPSRCLCNLQVGSAPCRCSRALQCCSHHETSCPRCFAEAPAPCADMCLNWIGSFWMYPTLSNQEPTLAEEVQAMGCGQAPFPHVIMCTRALQDRSAMSLHWWVQVELSCTWSRRSRLDSKSLFSR